MDPNLLCVMERFPERKRAIKELALRFPEFRSLCSDLSEAVEALNYWTTASSPAREARQREYEALVAELVAEIQSALENGTCP